MSTPSEPRQPNDGPVLEPIVVLRPRSTDALAELLREYREDRGGYESVALPRPPAGSEAETEELPPDTTGPRNRRAGEGAGNRRLGHRPVGHAAGSGPAGRGDGNVRARYGNGTSPLGYGAGNRPAGHGNGNPPAGYDDGHTPGRGLRAAAITVAVAAAAVIGFAGALLLPGRNTDDTAAPAPAPRPTSAATTPAPSAPAGPEGPGILKEGDSGPEVTDLQQRLLRIPNVYPDGSASGRYDATLTEAVARFQLWYGIRGDEDGVYGDDTRQALESRTAPGGG